MPHTWKRYFVAVGERVLIEAPWSEVCMHMQVAGKKMQAELLPPPPGRSFPRAVQLYEPDGRLFSAPILPGEAGFFESEPGQFYVYPWED